MFIRYLSTMKREWEIIGEREMEREAQKKYWFWRLSYSCLLLLDKNIISQSRFHFNQILCAHHLSKASFILCGQSVSVHRHIYTQCTHSDYCNIQTQCLPVMKFSQVHKLIFINVLYMWSIIMTAYTHPHTVGHCELSVCVYVTYFTLFSGSPLFQMNKIFSQWPFINSHLYETNYQNEYSIYINAYMVVSRPFASHLENTFHFQSSA